MFVPDTWGCSYVTRPAATHPWCPLGRSRCLVSREFGGEGVATEAWCGREGPAEVGSCGKAGRYVSVGGSG